MRLALPFIALVPGLVALGCGSGPVDGSAPLPAEAADFTGGQFQLFVEAVDDQCLDGALDLLFMPDGVESPYALQSSTYIPGFGELPYSYVIELAAPFTAIGVTVTRSDARMSIAEAPQDDVLLGMPGSDDCTGDIVFDATIRVESADRIRMDTTATLSGLTSPTETCPALDTDPCAAVLTMRGDRL